MHRLLFFISSTWNYVISETTSNYFSNIRCFATNRAIKITISLNFIIIKSISWGANFNLKNQFFIFLFFIFFFLILYRKVLKFFSTLFIVPKYNQTNNQIIIMSVDIKMYKKWLYYFIFKSMQLHCCYYCFAAFGIMSE